jgi:hypothetical protein
MYKRKYHFLLICQINTFETNIGVKQGCILSPTLFSSYINDLIDHFCPECEPLELNRKPISCLLYADDIILLSESAKGLQKSFDLLKTYCDKGSTIYLEGGGGLWIFVSFRHFCRTTRVRIFFFVARSVNLFSRI